MTNAPSRDSIQGVPGQNQSRPHVGILGKNMKDRMTRPIRLYLEDRAAGRSIKCTVRKNHSSLRMPQIGHNERKGLGGKMCRQRKTAYDQNETEELISHARFHSSPIRAGLTSDTAS